MNNSLKYLLRLQGIPDKNLNLKTSTGQKKMIELLNYMIENRLDLNRKRIFVDLNGNKYVVIFSYYEYSSISSLTSSDESWFVTITILGPNKSIVFKEYKNKNQSYTSKSFDFPNIDIKYEISESVNNGSEVLTFINRRGVIYDRYYHPNFKQFIKKHIYVGQGFHTDNDYWSEENGIQVRKNDDGTILIEEHSSSLGDLGNYSKKPGDKYITINKNSKKYYYDIEKEKLLNSKKNKEEKISRWDSDNDCWETFIDKDSNFNCIISLFSEFDKEVKWTNFSDEELIALYEQIKNNLVEEKEKPKSYRK